MQTVAKDKNLSALDRLIEQAMGDNRSFGLEDDPAKDLYPQLWRCMSTVYVGRDNIKQPATLGVSLVPGGVAMRLTDRDIKHSLEVIVPHLEASLAALETVLCSANPPWKAWGKGEPELRKRKHRN